jgi:hypothetical protein
MATTINATTTGLVETSDGTALLDLQTSGTTALRVNASQAIGVGSSPSFGTAGQFLTSQGNAASPTWTTGGTGTVTSVGWTGGIVSVASATTTPAFTIAGTSGGIPYFSSGTTWASSAALTANGVVYGGGAGVAPAATAAGTTGQFLGANTGGAPTWQTPSAGAGGSNTQVQYNNSGALAGISGFTSDGTRVTASTTIGVGGATPSTNGSGITFPTTQSASSNANTLDDYEKGTFIATYINGSGTPITPNGTSSASYTKIGRTVSIKIFNFGSSNLTSIRKIQGLPFDVDTANGTTANGVIAGQFGPAYAQSNTAIPNLSVTKDGPSSNFAQFNADYTFSSSINVAICFVYQSDQ